MKYQIGDRVKIKSFDWFRNGACIGFSTLMSKYCGEVLTIQSKNNTNTYCMKEDGGQFYWSDDMIEYVVNISKLGTAANPIEPKSNANCLTRERVDELAIKIDKELPSGNQNVWELPDGYQFVDENGNVINATKIALEKKKPEYPKTYEECCKVFGLNHYLGISWNSYDVYSGAIDSLSEQIEDIAKKLEVLSKLLLCRAAYWKIAGEEMGLGKSWEPDWTNYNDYKFVIGVFENEIIKCYNTLAQYVLAFPTEEMRDAFFDNFKEEIEKCKELL